MKKKISILLALALALSVFSIGAFAATRMLCGHGDVEEYSEEIPLTYVYQNETHHTVDMRHTSACRECDNVESFVEEDVLRRHRRFYSKPVTDETGQEVLSWSCACGAPVE